DELDFEWDETKHQKNVKKHGAIDFHDAMMIFDDPQIKIYPDTRKDYGENRFNAYGFSDGRCLRVCFTIRGENTIRIINAFKVHEKEWRKYYGNN
ncbi:MAG: BrnT family toxin, partial [Rickettsiales bacterium]|nr:BrnT family toxin [Rickettsiales bacterium]